MSGNEDRPPATFFLIHGTFARRAQWTSRGSAVRKHFAAAAEASGYKANFIPLRWSGRNSHHDRIAAATKLDKCIRKLPQPQIDSPIFLVGHSHGGSAIVDLLNNNHDLRQKITGSAFLSTPFFALRIKDYCNELYIAIMMSLTILFFTLSNFVFYWLSKPIGRWIYDNDLDELFPEFLSDRDLLSMPVNIFIFLISYLIYSTALRYQDKLRHAVDQRVNAQQTVRIPEGNNIFLRVAGDEVAAVLSAVQFLTWVMGFVSYFASRFLILLSSIWSNFGKYRLGNFTRLILALQFGIWILLILSANPDAWLFSHDPWDILFHFATKINMNLGIQVIILSALLKILALGNFLTVCVLFIYTSIVVFGLLVTVAALRAFGWIDVIGALFTDFAIEPVPYGRVLLEHFDWAERSEVEGSWLNHSRTYLHPLALNRLGEWVTESLKPIPRVR